LDVDADIEVMRCRQTDAEQDNEWSSNRGKLGTPGRQPTDQPQDGYDCERP
jgi:hypothetical protein